MHAWRPGPKKCCELWSHTLAVRQQPVHKPISLQPYLHRHLPGPVTTPTQLQTGGAIAAATSLPPLPLPLAPPGYRPPLLLRLLLLAAAAAATAAVAAPMLHNMPLKGSPARGSGQALMPIVIIC